MNVEKLKWQAQNGDPESQNDLGVAYMTGDGVDCDEKSAASWFHCAASQGHSKAAANYGMCLLLGKGTDQDLCGALYMLESAYLMGESQIIQGLLRAIKDKTVDTKGIMTLAENQNSQAQWVLSLCFSQGINMNVDVEKSVELLDKAGENNNPVALWMLANLFANSNEPDLLRAKITLDRAMAIAEKQVGLLGYPIKQTMIDICNKLQEECPYLLVKIIPECKEEGKPKDYYVQSFLNGSLYFRALEKFENPATRDADSDNDFRGDVLEGCVESFGDAPNPYLYAQRNGRFLKDEVVGLVDIRTLRKKVLCFCAIDFYKPRNAIIKPSEKMKKFGSYAVIIKDVEEFLKRVHCAFERYCREDNASYELNYGKVNYDVDMFEGLKYDEFHKSRSYSWQNEFRISIDFSEGKYRAQVIDQITDMMQLSFPGQIELDSNPYSIEDTLFFEIGDISDICQVMGVDNFFDEKFSSISIEKQPIVHAPYKTPHTTQPSLCKAIGIKFVGEYRLAVSEKILFSQ